ncbi:MAG: hypothetical protein WCE68_01920 [Anaerolineales bacterium]
MFNSAYLFLYFIIFCIGAAIGAYVERILKGRSTPLPPPPPPASDNKTLARGGDIEIFGAWRTSGNKLWLEMDGKRLENKDVLQPEQRQRLLTLLLDLRPWLESPRPATSQPEVAPQPVRPAGPAPMVSLQSSRPAAPAPTSIPQPVRPAMPSQPVQAEKTTAAPASEANKPAPSLDSIIQQIDKVLQAKLATSPLKDRDIQLVEGSGGIVIVKDGKNLYEGVDAIPDPEIKAFIQQAVADWEKGAR